MNSSFENQEEAIAEPLWIKKARGNGQLEEIMEMLNIDEERALEIIQTKIGKKKEKDGLNKILDTPLGKTIRDVAEIAEILVKKAKS